MKHIKENAYWDYQRLSIECALTNSPYATIFVNDELGMVNNKLLAISNELRR
jgi:hypothetical protein